ncbi:MAG: hypothetical protein WAM71_03670 [Candidatus Korobacteraceae bacterium]
MPRRSSKSKDHDFATVARRVVEQAIGETLTGETLPDPDAGKFDRSRVGHRRVSCASASSHRKEARPV